MRFGLGGSASLTVCARCSIDSRIELVSLCSFSSLTHGLNVLSNLIVERCQVDTFEGIDENSIRLGLSITPNAIRYLELSITVRKTAVRTLGWSM
jgi:hypothetical protein